MACLIKPYTSTTKGVLTLTTQERDRLVYKYNDIKSLLSDLKERYFIGLHHNWHNFSIEHDLLFDFHLAGEEDLGEIAIKNIPLLPMDACNFSPDCFQPSNDLKFWDILFVARAVEFKGIPEFFKAIRQLFDMGHHLRVLFICPIPPQAGVGSMREVRKLYESIFDANEQELFTLLTTDFRYPFPFDLPTLAHFYRSARIFVHSAPDERRCRVAAYAWASGLPVVGMAPVGSVLTQGLRRSPYFYEISSYEDFPKEILKALEVIKSNPSFEAVQKEIASKLSVGLFEKHLSRLFLNANLQPPAPGGWMHGLDIRLGRHHGLPAGTNKLEQDINGFLQFLLNATPSDIENLLQKNDPELEICRMKPFPPRKTKDTSSSALNRFKELFNSLYRYLIHRKNSL